MLSIIVGEEALNEETNEFVVVDPFNLQLEHSLASLSKWESIWEKPFLEAKDLTPEQTLSYIECMVVNPVFPPEVLHKLDEEQIRKIHAYMGSKQSATWFSEIHQPPKSHEIITSELIVFWMNNLNIPLVPAETWHLQRLFNVIRIHSLKNAKPKKMSRGEIARRNRELNEQRLKQMGTTG